MSRTNVDINDEACAAVMRRYRLASKREAVNLALRLLAAEPLRSLTRPGVFAGRAGWAIWKRCAVVATRGPD